MRNGCGWWCIFCWLEERHRRQLRRRTYWTQINEKRPPKV